MRNRRYLITAFILALLMLPLATGQAQERQKLAQTGMKFLSVSLDARISAMAQATTASHGSAAMMFYNPAGIANITQNADLTFGQTSWIADINYVHAAGVFVPFGGAYGVFGVNLMAVDYGDLQGTIRANNQQGYLDVGTFSPLGFAIGLSYAKSLSEKFAIGGTVKYVEQDLGSGIVDFLPEGGISESMFNTNALAFDFGLIYKTGFKSLNIGMSIRNFSQEIEFIEEGFQLPLNFKIGASFNMVDLMPELDKEQHSFVVNVDADHPRDYAERLFIGGEYLFMNTFAIRAGYYSPNEKNGFTAGAGVQQSLADIFVGVDYAYAPFGNFENDVHRISVRIGY